MADIGHSDWSLLPEDLDFILGQVAAREATRVVECGSGASTLAIARFLRDRGAGTVHSLEHDARWAQETRSALATQDLDGLATVIEAPLESHASAPPGCLWYARDALAQLPSDAIELLLVDGPPASPDSGAERSRYPALPLLRDRLGPGALVVLDDAGRAGEHWVIERWRAELDVDLRPVGARIAAGTIPG